jgi:hypothetical protein
MICEALLKFRDTARAAQKAPAMADPLARVPASCFLPSCDYLVEELVREEPVPIRDTPGLTCELCFAECCDLCDGPPPSTSRIAVVASDDHVVCDECFVALWGGGAMSDTLRRAEAVVGTLSPEEMLWVAVESRGLTRRGLRAAARSSDPRTLESVLQKQMSPGTLGATVMDLWATFRHLNTTAGLRAHLELGTSPNTLPHWRASVMTSGHRCPISGTCRCGGLLTSFLHGDPDVRRNLAATLSHAMAQKGTDALRRLVQLDRMMILLQVLRRSKEHLTHAAVMSWGGPTHRTPFLEPNEAKLLTGSTTSELNESEILDTSRSVARLLRASRASAHAKRTLAWTSKSIRFQQTGALATKKTPCVHETKFRDPFAVFCDACGCGCAHRRVISPSESVAMIPGGVSAVVKLSCGHLFCAVCRRTVTDSAEHTMCHVVDNRTGLISSKAASRTHDIFTVVDPWEEGPRPFGEPITETVPMWKALRTFSESIRVDADRSELATHIRGIGRRNAGSRVSWLLMQRVSPPGVLRAVAHRITRGPPPNVCPGCGVHADVVEACAHMTCPVCGARSCALCGGGAACAAGSHEPALGASSMEHMLRLGLPVASERPSERMATVSSEAHAAWPTTTDPIGMLSTEVVGERRDWSLHSGDNVLSAVSRYSMVGSGGFSPVMIGSWVVGPGICRTFPQELLEATEICGIDPSSGAIATHARTPLRWLQREGDTTPYEALRRAKVLGRALSVWTADTGPSLMRRADVRDAWPQKDPFTNQEIEIGFLPAAVVAVAGLLGGLFRDVISLPCGWVARDTIFDAFLPLIPGHLYRPIDVATPSRVWTSTERVAVHVLMTVPGAARANIPDTFLDRAPSEAMIAAAATTYSTSRFPSAPGVEEKRMRHEFASILVVGPAAGTLVRMRRSGQNEANGEEWGGEEAVPLIGRG